MVLVKSSNFLLLYQALKMQFWVSTYYREYLVRLCFFFYSANLCLWLGCLIHLHFLYLLVKFRSDVFLLVFFYMSVLAGSAVTKMQLSWWLIKNSDLFFTVCRLKVQNQGASITSSCEDHLLDCWFLIASLHVGEQREKSSFFVALIMAPLSYSHLVWITSQRPQLLIP